MYQMSTKLSLRVNILTAPFIVNIFYLNEIGCIKSFDGKKVMISSSINRNEF